MQSQTRVMTFNMKNKIKPLHPRIRVYHTAGFTNRTIATMLAVSHRAIGDALHEMNLATNGSTRKLLKIVNGLGVCTKCTAPKPLSEFHTQRSNAKYPYRLTYCDACRRQQQIDSLNSDIYHYLDERHRRTVTRARKAHIPFALTRQELYDAFDTQRGLCFYTDTPLVCRVGEGIHRDGCSVDRVDPQKGYTKANIVLCTYKVNSVKNDLTLEEIKSWMPGWFERLSRRVTSR